MNNIPMTSVNLPSVELFIASSCSHCPLTLAELSSQLKSGKLSSLLIHNIAVDNKRAEELNIRSVPWFSLKNNHALMIFSGNYSAKEIQQWLKISKTETGMKEYIEEMLSTGQLPILIHLIQLSANMFSHIIDMLKDEETSMDIRIGLDALIESFSASDILKKHINDFEEIASSNNVRLQVDALHYLALTADPTVQEFLTKKTKDNNEQIKEAAIESLEVLNDLLV